MLIAELKNRPSLVLSEDTNSRYKLYASNKREVKELQELLALSPDDPDERLNNYDFLFLKELEIDMVGHISEVRPIHINDIIKKVKDHVLKDGKEEEVTPEYTCYQEHKTLSRNNNVVKHEEKLSSFRCACELMRSEYFIVLKEIKNFIKLGIGIEAQIPDKTTFQPLSYKNLKELQEDGDS